MRSLERELQTLLAEQTKKGGAVQKKDDAMRRRVEDAQKRLRTMWTSVGCQTDPPPGDGLTTML